MKKYSRSELERHIGDCAEQFGWRHHRTRAPEIARDGYPDGFPSETLIRAGRLMFIMLAPASGHLSSRETAWVEELGEVRTVEAHVFRAGDLEEFRRVVRLLRPDREPPEEAAT